MEQLIHALDHNFEAEERMRQVEQDKNFYDNTGGGMTLSGGVNDSWEIIERSACCLITVWAYPKKACRWGTGNVSAAG